MSGENRNAGISGVSGHSSLRALHQNLLLHWQHEGYRDGRASPSTAADELQRVYSSFSWRIMAPYRWMMGALLRRRFVRPHHVHLVKVFLFQAKRDGVGKAGRKAIGYLRGRSGITQLFGGSANPAAALLEGNDPKGIYPQEAPALFKRSVALICETSLPQCYKYRVAQKAELLRLRGAEVVVMDWREKEKCISALQVCTTAIFYRVPYMGIVPDLYGEAKRLQVPIFWEVDDLVFDRSANEKNKNLDTISASEKAGILNGATLYRQGLMHADEAIASTATLKSYMDPVTPACIVENALDADTVSIAKALGRERKVLNVVNPFIDIIYGSGSRAHDRDFREAEQAIINVLNKRDNVRFIVMGDLNVSAELEAFASRFVRLPFADFKTYLRVLSGADISIAPLETTGFNDAKSNIKFLEASVLKLPSVCSAAAEFRAAIIPGVNGFLAETEDEWESSLLALVDSSALREQISREAYKLVFRRYSPVRVARNRIEPILEKFDRVRTRRRVLAVNIFFAPISFGGATIVAEQMSQRIGEGEGEMETETETEMFVLTSLNDPLAADYSFRRYRAKGAHVIAIKLPLGRDRVQELYDEVLNKKLGSLIRSINPDIVHFHSIQGLSLGMAEICKESKIPYVITLHDAWWLCQRQFMVNDRGTFCNQNKIDPLVCSLCVPDMQFDSYRRQMCRAVLDGAALLLAPSEYFKHHYALNGLPIGNIVTNRNGVSEPAFRTSLPRKEGPLRFAYIGGKGEAKGFDVIVSVVNKLLGEKCNLELLIADNSTNLGFRSIFSGDFEDSSRVHIVPAYTQATIDEFFDQFDVLLFPTQAKESFGLAVREALIRDKWVIVSDAGGVVEDVVDGVNGTIIPVSRNPDHLERAMRALLEKIEMFDTYVNPFKDRIQTFDGQARELSWVYDEIIQRRTAEPASEKQLLQTLQLN